VVNAAPGSAAATPEGGGRHGWRGPEPTGHVPDGRPSTPSPGRHAAPDDEDDVEQTVRVPRDQVSNVRPDFAPMGGRVTSPPGSPADTKQTTKMGFGAEPAGPRARHPEPPARPEGEQPGQMWNRVKDNLFGAPTIVGAVALAAIAMHSAAGLVGPGVDGGAARSIAGVVRPAASVSGSAEGPGALRALRVDQAALVPRTVPDCAFPDAAAPPATGIEPAANVTALPSGIEPAADECLQPGIGSLHYNLPMLPDDLDFGPPIHI